MLRYSVQMPATQSTEVAAVAMTIQSECCIHTRTRTSVVLEDP